MTEPDAAPPPSDDVPIKQDFSRRQAKPIPFRVDDRVYRAPARLHPAALADIGKIYASLSEVDLDRLQPAQLDTVMEAFAGLIEAIVRGEGGKHLADRLRGKAEPGLDLVEQAIPIVNWLLEEYGYRPSLPSLLLPAGMTAPETAGQTDDTSSTDGASPATSTT